VARVTKNLGGTKGMMSSTENTADDAHELLDAYPTEKPNR